MFGLPQKYVDFLLNTVIFSKDGQIDALRSELKYCQLELISQRRRADMAIDQLLASSGKATVMPERTTFNEPKTAEDRAAEKARQAIYDSMKSEMEKVGDTGTLTEDVGVTEEVQ